MNDHKKLQDGINKVVDCMIEMDACRGKKDNLVSIGTWVLIGKRNWETSRDGKLENCDLLVVYREDEKKKTYANL
jgi:hypothetical protein